MEDSPVMLVIDVEDQSNGPRILAVKPGPSWAEAAHDQQRGCQDDEPLLPQEKPKRKKAPFDCLIKPQVAPSSVTPLFEADGPLERKPRVSIALDS